MQRFLKFALCLTVLSNIAPPAPSQAASPGQPESPLKPAGTSAIPGPGAPVDQRAIAALGKAQHAVGGLRRLRAIRDVTRVVEMVNLAADGRAKATFEIVFPNAIRLTTDSPLGEVTAFSDGKTAWASSVLGVDEALPEWQVRAARQDLFRQLEFLLQSDRDPDKKVEFVERSQVEARPADVIQITSGVAGTIRFWIDVASGDVLELEYRRIVARGTGPVVADFFSDYRWVNNTLRIPFHTHTLSDGQPYMDTRVLRAEYNRGLRAEVLGQKHVPKRR